MEGGNWHTGGIHLHLSLETIPTSKLWKVLFIYFSGLLLPLLGLSIEKVQTREQGLLHLAIVFPLTLRCALRAWTARNSVLRKSAAFTS